jgi:hypothetical protein
LRYDDELRSVLNAAWKRRIDEDDLSRVDEVAKAAVKLWDMIEKNKSQDKGDRFSPPRQPIGRASAPVSKPSAPGRFDEGT